MEGGFWNLICVFSMGSEFVYYEVPSSREGVFVF
jgi:hypothetical protein